MKKALSIILAIAMLFSLFTCVTVTSVSAATGTTYYVSNSSGSDSNDGSQANPWKTVDKVNSASLNSGDAVLFKCGDEWRGISLQTKQGVTYGSYGTGNKPIFNGSSRNYSDSSLWVTTETDKVYKLDIPFSNDVGGIIFNDGEAWGQKLNETSISASTEDLSFFFTGGYVFLYCENGNPASLYSSIELIEYGELLTPVKGVTVNGISFKHKNFGICANSADGVLSGITIENCDFFGIGGCRYTNEQRYGNAIEFFGSSNNITVKNCNFSQIFDTAFTCQSSYNNTTISDITVSGNTIDKCHWGIEFWVNADSGIMKDITVSNNKFTDIAKSWGEAKRWQSYVYEGANISNLSVDKSAKSNIQITGNDFGATGAKLLELRGEGWILSGNTYRQYDGKPFGYLGSTEYVFNDDFINNTLKTADTSAVIAKAKTDNLIVNGDFEDGLNSGWNVYATGNSSWDVGIEQYNFNSIFYTGKKTLMLRHLWLEVHQIVNVEENTDYIFTFYAKGNKSGSDMAVTVKDADSNNIEKIVPDNTSYFKKYTCTVNSGNNKQLKIFFNGNGGDGNTYMYFDEVSLVKADDGNLLVNGGFEDGTYGWNFDSNGRISVSTDANVAHSGQKFMDNNQNYWAKATQTVELKPNTEYEYSFWYRVLNPSSVEWNFKLDGMPGTFAKLNSTGGSWVQLTGSFNSGSAASTTFWFENNNSHGNFFIDDCMLKEKEIIPSNIVINGGFENGLDGWTISGSSNVGTTTYYKNSGTKSLELHQGWLYVQQVVSVEPYTDYDYDLFCRYPTGSQTTFNFFDVATGNSIENVSLINSSSFSEYSGTFNTGSATSIRVRIDSNGQGSSAFFDDITLEKTPKNPELVVNGGFEDGESGWVDEGSANTTIYYKHQGSNALELHNWYQKVLQNIAVEAYTDYDYDFFCYYGTGSQAKVTFYNAATGSVIKEIKLDNATNFKEYSGTINSGSANAIKIEIYSNGGDTNLLFFDDFSVRMTNDGNILVNGNFEDGAAGWGLSTNAYVYYDNAKAARGNRFFMKTNTGWSSSVQEITLKPNTYYEYSFYYNMSKPTSNSFVRIDGFDSTKTNFTDTNGTWVQAKGIFYSGSKTSSVFRIEANGSHGTFMIDKCCVKIAEPILGDVNGNFTLDSNDLTLMRKYILGVETADFVESNADIVKDNKINLLDLVALKKEIAKQIA